MLIRETKGRDIDKIDEIYRQYHQDHFGLPNLRRSVTHAVVEKDNKVVGFGVVKLYAEAVMVLDLSETKGDRLDALELLLHEAFRACEEQGIEQLHVYVQDPKLQRLLEKRFDFKVATGVALVREI